jgi:hypothetical protein
MGYGSVGALLGQQSAQRFARFRDDGDALAENGLTGEVFVTAFQRVIRSSRPSRAIVLPGVRIFRRIREIRPLLQVKLFRASDRFFYPTSPV